jgi:hypothetical protein
LHRGPGQQWFTPPCPHSVSEENSKNRDESLQAANASDALFPVERFCRNAAGDLFFPDIFGPALPQPDHKEKGGTKSKLPRQILNTLAPPATVA